MNFKGSVPAMEPEEAERVFKRFVENHGLYYTEYQGDEKTKSFQRVKGIYIYS